MQEYSLSRFINRQAAVFDGALSELKNGKKIGHWMWYVLPQLRGLGRSRKSYVFGLRDADEARAYLSHALLGPRLIACFEALLSHKNKTAEEILGETDAQKLFSCATLFSLISEEGSVFHKALEQFYGGRQDPLTAGLVFGKIIDATHLKYIN